MSTQFLFVNVISMVLKNLLCLHIKGFDCKWFIGNESSICSTIKQYKTEEDVDPRKLIDEYRYTSSHHQDKQIYVCSCLPSEQSWTIAEKTYVKIITLVGFPCKKCLRSELTYVLKLPFSKTSMQL